MQEAKYYLKKENKAVQCCLCPNYCYLEEGKTSHCLSRKNINGVLVAVNYAQTISLNVDPIEKKPLYHYYPGSTILSVGANSCNLHCDFCQNASISQVQNKTTELTPENLIAILKRENQKQIAFTYTEPFTWYEFIIDFARLAVEEKIRIVLVTNGYINPEPLKEILPYIDAMNIDLKGMSEDFYGKICAGKLKPVLETIKTAYQHCHIEITNLIIPGLNDSEEMITKLVDFLADIDADIPLHFSRYFPQYKSDRPSTPESTLQQAYKIAQSKLHNVYLGNINAGDKSNTICYKCKTVLIDRNGYQTRVLNLKANRCTVCNTVLYGKF